MERKRVKDILLPYDNRAPLNPSIGLMDRLTDAVELMVRNNVNKAAVILNKRPIGVISLDDALQVLGLRPFPEKAARL